MGSQKLLFKNDSVENVTTEAIIWLQNNLVEKHALVLFSGGKDSIVIEALMKMAKIPYSLNSTLTGIDPPEVTRFIRKYYPHCTFVRPHLSFWHLLTTHNPPAGSGKGIKWCCTKIKENPSNIIPIKHRILGIRAEESFARAKYERINYVKDQIHYYPIYHWKEWQIWEFIKKYELPYPKMYDEGFNRIGCVICPNHQNHHEQYKIRYPNHFKCFEKYVNIWWNKRIKQGKEMYYGSVEEFLDNWYKGNYYYYKH